jgi:putative transposase
MNTLYLICQISRQGHHQNVNRELLLSENEYLYVAMIEQIRELHPGMGLRKMYEQFEPENIGRDAFISLGLRNGFRLNPPASSFKTTYPIVSAKYTNLLINKKFTDVNQIWVSDIYYFPKFGRNYYGVLIMDVYSRRIVGYSMSTNMKAENNIRALCMALNLRGISNYEGKLIHHSDRGSQYISNEYIGLLEQYGIRVSMCKTVLENSHSERANGTIKNEYLNRWQINSEYELINEFKPKAVENYNNRKHNSLEMTPLQFEAKLERIELKDRNILEIYTVDKSEENPFQLKLDLN